MSIRAYVEELDTINREISANNARNRSLRKRLKEVEKNITDYLNIILENMILKKPGQWIWSHNRWKQ